MGAGYQQHADAIFGVAADALIAPPMPAPQVLWPWETPADTTVLVDGPPVWQGALAQTSATDDEEALSAISNASTREASFKVASTGQAVCAEHVTAADEAACEAAGAGRASQIVAAMPYPPPPSPSPSPR